MHRDRVVARISLEPPAGRIKGRREGRVIRILERAHDTIVGTLQRSRNFYYVVPDDPRFVHDVYVRPVAAVQETGGRRPRLQLVTKSWCASTTGNRAM
jgi:Exoribonuclease R